MGDLQKHLEYGMMIDAEIVLHAFHNKDDGWLLRIKGFRPLPPTLNKWVPLRHQRGVRNTYCSPHINHKPFITNMIVIL